MKIPDSFKHKGIRTPRWLVLETRAGQPTGRVEAILDGHRFSAAFAEGISQTMADLLQRPVIVVQEKRGARRSNPTLVHHGVALSADFHVLTAGGDPLADLYFRNVAVARKVAQTIANELRYRVNVVSNDHEPARLAEHKLAAHAAPRRRNPGGIVAGQVWNKRGGGSARVIAVHGNTVELLDLSSGNRDRMDVAEFRARFIERPRRNPRRTKKTWCGVDAVGSYFCELPATMTHAEAVAEATEIAHNFTGRKIHFPIRVLTVADRQAEVTAAWEAEKARERAKIARAEKRKPTGKKLLNDLADVLEAFAVHGDVDESQALHWMNLARKAEVAGPPAETRGALRDAQRALNQIASGREPEDLDSIVHELRALTGNLPEPNPSRSGRARLARFWKRTKGSRTRKQYRAEAARSRAERAARYEFSGDRSKRDAANAAVYSARAKVASYSRRSRDRQPNPKPAVGSYWSRLAYPQHLARVVRLERAAGGAPPMVELEIVTGRGAVMGQTRMPVNDLAADYEPLAVDSPYRKTLPRPNPRFAAQDWGPVLGQVTVGRTTYNVHRGAHKNVPWVLTGPRGAAWALFRYVDKPYLFHAMSASGRSMYKGPMQGKVFTGEDVDQLAEFVPPRRNPARGRRNPAFTIEGTLRVAEAVPAVSPPAPLSIVRGKRARAPRAPRAPRARAERFTPGDPVTVPYVGPASVGGRAVKRTRDQGVVQGYEGHDPRTGEPIVRVYVRRGKNNTEEHRFTQGNVRKRRGTASRAYKPVREKHPRIFAQLEREVGGRLERGLEIRELMDDEYNMTEALAKARTPQYGEAPTPEYTRLRAKLRQIKERARVLEAVLQPLAGEGPDPWTVSEEAGRRLVANPRGDAAERAQAEEMFKTWHEFGSHGIKRVRVPSSKMPKYGVKLGEVVTIDYVSDKWGGRPVTYTHDTKRPRPMLVASPDGRQLYLVGGKMKPTADGLVN